MAQPGHMGATVGIAEPSERGTGMALVFRAGLLLCAVPLAEAIETLRPLHVQPLAGAPPHVRGVSIMRGVPAPVVDVARLLGDAEGQVCRFIAVRTQRGPLALATGPVLGVRATYVGHDADEADAGALPAGAVAAIGADDGEPLFLLHCARLVPPTAWSATEAADRPS